MPFNVTCGMVQNPWCDPRPYDERCFCRSTTSHVSKVVNLSCKRMFYSIESAIRFQGLTFFVFFLCLSTMQFPGGPAAEVSLEKNYEPNQRKNLLIECAQGDQPVRWAQTEFFACTSLLAFWWWLVVFPWCVGGGDVMCGAVLRDVMWLAARSWSSLVGCELAWGEVMWLVATCHVMSCGVMSCHLTLCDVISCVVSFHVM